MANKIEFMDWWKKADAEVEAVAASLNPKSEIQNLKSPDPFLCLAAEVKDLAASAMCEGRAALVESLNKVHANGLHQGFCDGLVQGARNERARLRFRAMIAAQDGAFFWMFVGAVMMASAIALAVGLAQLMGR